MVTFTMNLICSDCPVENIGILNSHLGSIKHHFNSLGPSQETYKEATKTETISFVRKKICTLELDTMGETKTLHSKTTAEFE